MGHALNNSIQDCLIRYHRMRGQRTKWILGTDHAGIGTQVQVEKALIAEGTSREQLGREAFVERVWRWRDQYGGQIIQQLKRLGASLDYDDERYARLVGEKAILPLVGRKLKIIADEYVKPEFGTGALKITPGHDPNDFDIGRRHGLPEVSVIGEDARISAQAPERFVGMSI